MTQHDFTIILEGIEEITPEIEDALFAAGCDDATICARGRKVYLMFFRDCSSRVQAIQSAIKEIQGARLGCTIRTCSY